MVQGAAIELLSPGDIAKLLGLHERTVQLFLKQGKIKGMKVGRKWRAYRSDIEDYLAEQRQAAYAAAQAEGQRD
jgi:excisionase family DNA binding protein